MAESDKKLLASNSLTKQVEELYILHDHITRVVADLDVSAETFSDRYPRPGKADFAFESVFLMYLYQYVRGFNRNELHRRLAGTAYVYIRFDLPRPPTQQAISYIWRNRLSLADRRTIKATARAIREIAAEHGIVSSDEPRLRPDEVDAGEITDDQIMDAVETARDRGLDEFGTDRATNATFEDLAFFERQAGEFIEILTFCIVPAIDEEHSVVAFIGFSIAAGRAC